MTPSISIQGEYPPPDEATLAALMSTHPRPVGLETILASIPRGCYNAKGDDDGNAWSLSSSPPPPLQMPAEWSPHAACLILFPHNRRTFRLEKARREVLQMARAIALDGREDVYLLCHDDELAGWVEEQVASMMNRTAPTDDTVVETNHHKTIHTFVCPSDDTWVRDTGPTFVWQTETNDANGAVGKHRRLIGLDWDFNAYGGPIEGGCYWPCVNDQNVAKTVCQQVVDCPSYKIPIVMEGGSIHTDGEGTILTTEECLRHVNRNRHLSGNDIERVLCESLGASKVIWLPTGLDADDDTNGHIDNFACFVAPGHVVLAWTDDHQEDAENYQRCREAERVLLESTDAKGRSIHVTKLHLPSPPLRYTHEEANSLAYLEDEDVNGGSTGSNYIMSRQPGEKMAASYINFYIANQAVVVPQFGVETTDQMALDTLQNVFPDRKVVGVASREILLGGGNIHCQTQQVPA